MGFDHVAVELLRVGNADSPLGRRCGGLQEHFRATARLIAGFGLPVLNLGRSLIRSIPEHNALEILDGLFIQFLLESDFAQHELRAGPHGVPRSLGRLLEIRRDLTKRRREFLQKVLQNNPYVRIEVVPYGARDTVEAEFRILIQREPGGFEKDIGPANGEGLLGRLYSGECSQEKVEERLKDLKQRVGTITSGNLDGIELGDRRFATHLAKLPPEAVDRLDLWFPEDSLKVEYSATADGNQFRSIQEGSPGQKTAALLAFLLSYGDEPIVLDQPEDDLDNHLVYELIVTQLRNIKQRRQVLVVTHNANIVVNGDAELVVGLTARGGETQRECSGCLQERAVRDTICAVMEGGREAFEKRYRRIALEGRLV